MEYEVFRFRDIATLINGRAYLMPELQDEGKYRIVRVGNFTGKDEWFYSDMELDEDKYCHKGDLLYKWACTFGPEIWKEEKTIYHYHIWKVIPKTGFDKGFLYYYLKLHTPYWLGGTNGATMVHITKASMENKKVSFPPYENQCEIADILSTYDDLIENNNKRIKLLEQMAENLYKEWFVRFRFPGYETAEFKDGIPADWEYVKLGEKLNFERGVGYSSADLMDADNVLLSMNNIRPWGGFIRDYSRKYSGKFKEFQVVKQNDLIMSITDMTQDRRIIGYVGLVPHSKQTRIICTHLMKVTSINSEYDNVFLYGLFNFSGLSRYISERATGANVLGLTANILNNVKWYFPTLDLIHKYCAVVKPLYEAIEQYEEQNENLIKQRDLLLPRLMSGKLEV